MSEIDHLPAVPVVVYFEQFLLISMDCVYSDNFWFVFLLSMPFAKCNISQNATERASVRNCDETES